MHNNCKQKRKIRKNADNKPRRPWKAIAIALYITFILLSAIPFVADNTLDFEMNESYTYHLSYPEDGRQTHYYVERVNTSMIGRIDLTYTTATNSLKVQTTNVKVLYIYCRSMYEDECEDVYGFNPLESSNFYKWYFIERDHFSVTVESDHKINELSFIDTPLPYKVIVNGEDWVEGKQYNYTNKFTTSLSYVPKGTTNVDIYFKPNHKSQPYASFVVDRSIVNIDELVKFDATASFDIDGQIIAFIWDFGDGNNSGGELNSHSYSQPGEYGVILTVRDNDFMIDHAYLNITVVTGASRPFMNGIIPDQIKEEDSPPWVLDLSGFGLDFNALDTEFKWFLTGEDANLYQLIGENSTTQKLIFLPVPNVYGYNKVTLWLMNVNGLYATQPLWINITPVNDKPVIDRLPELYVCNDVRYSFSLTNYINDIETSREKLIVSTTDNYDNEYLTLNGQELMLNYPKELKNKVILITVIVSDSEDSSSSILQVHVSNNLPPVLKDSLPDISLDEGTEIKDAIDLADHFSDPDGDKLIYILASKPSRPYVKVTINSNDKIDVISQSGWTGDEFVTIRALDTQGAFVEDEVKISVLPVNDPPVIGNVPNLMVHHEINYYFDLSTYISDPDNKLEELTMQISGTDNISINPENKFGIILNYPSSMVDITSTFDIIVSDGNLETSKTISVTVMEGYAPELVRDLPDVVFDEDNSLTNVFDLDDYFIDLDNERTYSSYGNTMIDITIGQDNKVSFSAPDNWFGLEEVTFRATDPTYALVEDSVIVIVMPVNDRPVIAKLPSVTLNESETMRLDLWPYLSDVDNTISSLSILADEPEPNVIVVGTNLIIYGSKQLHDEIEITVNDGEASAAEILKVDVLSRSSSEKKEPFLNEVIFLLILVIIIVVILITLYFVMKKGKYAIEEIMLLHNSGKLLGHIYCNPDLKFDKSTFTHILTASQKAIEILNASKIPSEVMPMEVDDIQLMVGHGKHIFMTLVYTGSESSALHKKLQEYIHLVEKRYGNVLSGWDGDIRKVIDINQYLEKMTKKPETKSDKPLEDQQQQEPLTVEPIEEPPE